MYAVSNRSLCAVVFLITVPNLMASSLSSLLKQCKLPIMFLHPCGIGHRPLTQKLISSCRLRGSFLEHLNKGGLTLLAFFERGVIHVARHFTMSYIFTCNYRYTAAYTIATFHHVCIYIIVHG